MMLKDRTATPSLHGSSLVTWEVTSSYGDKQVRVSIMVSETEDSCTKRTGEQILMVQPI